MTRARDNSTPEVFAAGTLVLVGLLMLTGVIHAGNPGPSIDEARARSEVSATATVRSLQTYGNPGQIPSPTPYP